MIFGRMLIYLLGKLINFDAISDKFPVSVKSVIVDEKRVLLLKNERGEWDLPGGKIENRETVADTLVREVKEETNITIDEYSILHADKYFIRDQGVIVIIFYAMLTGEEPIRMSFENIDYSFFSDDEVRKLKLTPWARDGLEKFRKRVSKR